MLTFTASWLSRISWIILSVGAGWTSLEALRIMQEPELSGGVVTRIALGWLGQIASLAREDAEEIDLQIVPHLINKVRLISGLILLD